MTDEIRGVCDLGNSRLKWGVGCDVKAAINWCAHGALDYDRVDRLPGLLQAAGARGEVLVASVAGGVREQAVGAALAGGGFAVRRFVAGAAWAGVHNDYADPSQLGVDRWAALLGAWRLVGAPTLVVSAGTATTVDLLDLVDGRGHFRGGAILPGIALMRSALADGTAGLPLARGALTDLPRNTDDAIATGILEAQLGAIERLRRRLPPGAGCLLTGGNASALLPHLDAPAAIRETLVLDGLLVAASP